MFSGFGFLEFSSNDRNIEENLALEIELHFYLLLGN